MGRQGSFQTVESSRSKSLGLEWLETQKAAQAGTMEERRLMISEGEGTRTPYCQALLCDGTLAFILSLKNDGET